MWVLFISIELYYKLKLRSWGHGAEVIEHLPSKALSSNNNTACIYYYL
jgi:hypothetical protein